MRGAIETLYTGICSISEYRAVEDKVTKITAFKEVLIYKDYPCRVSFNSIHKADSSGIITGASQSVKLFICSRVDINPGSKITVVQNGFTGEYKSSGVPAIYSNHQEVLLEIFKEFA